MLCWALNFVAWGEPFDFDRIGLFEDRCQAGRVSSEPELTIFSLCNLPPTTVLRELTGFGVYCCSMIPCTRVHCAALAWIHVHWTWMHGVNGLFCTFVQDTLLGTRNFFLEPVRKKIAGERQVEALNLPFAVSGS